MSGRGVAIGIEIGGSHLAIGTCADNGASLSFESMPLPTGGPLGVIEAIADKLQKIDGPVGVGLAAQIGPSGYVKVAPSLGWRDIPFGDDLSSALGRDVVVVNDLSAVAFGEWAHGAGGRSSGPLYCVFVGSGIGSALIVDGRVYEGATGVAGELGHVKIKPGGDPCGCGERGCLEAYVGGLALARRSGGRTASEIEAAVARGETWATPLWGAVARELPIAIANAIAILNPAVLVLGGGVIEHSANLFDSCAASIRAFAPRVAIDGLKIVRGALGARAGVIGAAALAAL